MPLHAHGPSPEEGIPAAVCVGVVPVSRREQRGKNGSVPIGRSAEGGVMVKAAPAASFIVTQSEFLLQFFIVTLDDPAMFSQAHQMPQVGIGRQSG